MAQARGINTKVQAWQETTFGTTPGSPTTENMYFKTFPVSGKIAQIVDATMAGGLRGRVASIQGNRDVTGTITTTLAPESCVKYLANLIGTPTITNLGVSKNQFVFAPGTGALALPVGMGFEVDYSTAIATPGRFLRYAGCRISKGKFTFKSDGLVEADYDIIGSSFDWSQSATISATPGDFGHSGFSMFTAALQEGGSASTVVQQVDLTLDNQLDNSLYTIGGGGVRGALPEGFFASSGMVTALFQDMSILTKALNSTDSSLQITFTKGTGDGSAGNDSLVFLIPHLQYELAAPPIDGPKGLMAKLNFTGNRVGTSEDGFSVTLKTPRATA